MCSTLASIKEKNLFVEGLNLNTAKIIFILESPTEKEIKDPQKTPALCENTGQNICKWLTNSTEKFGNYVRQNEKIGIMEASSVPLGFLNDPFISEITECNNYFNKINILKSINEIYNGYAFFEDFSNYLDHPLISNYAGYSQKVSNWKNGEELKNAYKILMNTTHSNKEIKEIVEDFDSRFDKILNENKYKELYFVVCGAIAQTFFYHKYKNYNNIFCDSKSLWDNKNFENEFVVNISQQTIKKEIKIKIKFIFISHPSIWESDSPNLNKINSIRSKL